MRAFFDRDRITEAREDAVAVVLDDLAAEPADAFVADRAIDEIELVQVFGIDSYHYWNNSQQFVENWDLFYGIFKSVFFGATIAIVSCYRGFNCAPGAEGVGRAATAAFVLSFVIILILDLGLSISLDRVHHMLWPEIG